MNVKPLIEERVKLHADSLAMLDRASSEKRTLTQEEQATFDRMHERMAEIKATTDRAAIHDAEETALTESRGRQTETRTEVSIEVVDGAQDAQMALRAWALGGRGRHVTSEMLAACQRMRFDPSTTELEVRALNSITATQGQNSIPDEMMRAFYDIQKWYVPIRSYATILNTATGAPLPVPTGDDTSNTGEIIADSGAVTTTVDPSFGQVVLNAYKFSSKAVIVSVELLQDSYINLAQYLGQKLGIRIGRAQSTYFTTGTGTSQPKGVQVAASLGKTAAVTTAITFDEIIDLEHSVDKAYRGPSCAFMMHDTIAAALRKLKDSQNRYLWEVSPQVAEPDRLNGYPVIINNDMDSTFAANKRLVLFGDFSYYNIRDAGGPTFIRADELYVLTHQVAFLAFQRSDGNLIDTTSIRYLRTP